MEREGKDMSFDKDGNHLSVSYRDDEKLISELRNKIEELKTKLNNLKRERM